MFSAMLEGIRGVTVGYLFNLEVEVQEKPIVEEVRGDAETRRSSPVGNAGAGGVPPSGVTRLPG
ncbi:hypothetical protein GCM10020219_024470 [Nonomuraea dietziae]